MTTIDLTQFNFNSRIFNQITDCPNTGLVRVLVYTGDNYQESIKRWFLNARIDFINPNNNKIVYSKIAKSKNKEWVIDNTYQITILDNKGKPTPNPDFKTKDEDGNILDISENNLPYITQGAFDRFSEFRVGTGFSLSMRQLWNLSVISDDANGYFDEKESHKTIVDIQKEMHEAAV